MKNPEIWDPFPIPERAPIGMPSGNGSDAGAFFGLYDQTLRGGDGDDFLRLKSSVMGDKYDNGYVYGGAGNDDIRGNIGYQGDNLSGGDGDDRIVAAGDGDRLFGDSGNDVMHGDGDTYMHGGTGSDSLYGGNGDDTLDGGYGRDWLKGGGGADTFLFSEMDRASWSDDGIEDFSRAEGDKIRLMALRDWHNNHISVKGFDDLNIVDYGDHWKVFIDHDIKFGVLKGDYGHLQASDFIFDSV